MSARSAQTVLAPVPGPPLPVAGGCPGTGGCCGSLPGPGVYHHGCILLPSLHPCCFAVRPVLVGDGGPSLCYRGSLCFTLVQDSVRCRMHRDVTTTKSMFACNVFREGFCAACLISGFTAVVWFDSHGLVRHVGAWGAFLPVLRGFAGFLIVLSPSAAPPVGAALQTLCASFSLRVPLFGIWW